MRGHASPQASTRRAGGSQTRSWRASIERRTGQHPNAPSITSMSLGSSRSARCGDQIEQLLANRFPRPDLPTLVQALPAESLDVQRAPGPVGMTTPELAPRGTGRPTHIPAAVERAVWERDGGRCTFVGENGTGAWREAGSSSILSSRSLVAARRRWPPSGSGVGRTPVWSRAWVRRRIHEGEAAGLSARGGQCTSEEYKARSAKDRSSRGDSRGRLSRGTSARDRLGRGRRSRSGPGVGPSRVRM